MRAIREIVNEALAALSPAFEKLYAKSGRPSIPPEKLLRALLLQAFYSVRSERRLTEPLDDNLLFRCRAVAGRGSVGRDRLHQEPRAADRRRQPTVSISGSTSVVQTPVFCTGARDGAMASVEVLVGPARRRRWSVEQKQAIVAAAFRSGAVVRDVARQADVTASLISRWRRDLRAAANGLAQVLVAPAGDGVAAPAVLALDIELPAILNCRRY